MTKSIKELEALPKREPMGKIYDADKWYRRGPRSPRQYLQLILVKSEGLTRAEIYNKLKEKCKYTPIVWESLQDTIQSVVYFKCKDGLYRDSSYSSYNDGYTVEELEKTTFWWNNYNYYWDDNDILVKLNVKPRTYKANNSKKVKPFIARKREIESC